MLDLSKQGRIKRYSLKYLFFFLFLLVLPLSYALTWSRPANIVANITTTNNYYSGNASINGTSINVTDLYAEQYFYANGSLFSTGSSSGGGLIGNCSSGYYVYGQLDNGTPLCRPDIDTDTDTDTNTNAATMCDGTNVYLDGDGNCDTLTVMSYAKLAESNRITITIIP